MIHLKRINENIKENPIDIDKLKKYSMGISICCAGEYGMVFYKESENHIFICLGDSNPFDDEMLKEYLKNSISTSYKYYNQIKVTIENECYATGEGWKIFDPKTNEFKDWKYKFIIS